MSTRNNRQRRCMRNNKNLQGGGLGNSYTMGEMISRGNFVNETYSSCGAMSRPGALTTAQIGTFKGGLPGLSGGSRRRHRKHKGTRNMRKGRKHRNTRRMHGGRYGMSMDGPEFAALGPRGGMMATAERIACESGVPPHVSQTTPTAPAMRGGAQLAPAPFLQEQTAGYSQSPSEFLGSTGAPIMLNIPAGGRMGVPACAQTGGRRKHRRAHRKSSHKNRKTQRKHRKSSRKH